MIVLLQTIKDNQRQSKDNQENKDNLISKTPKT